MNAAEMPLGPMPLGRPEALAARQHAAQLDM